MFTSCNRPRKFTIFCLSSLTLISFSWVVQASADRRELIQGAVTINEDISGSPESDRWPYTAALAVCEDGVPTSVICGSSIIHPYVVLTAAHCLRAKNDSPLPLPSSVCIVHGARNMTEGLLNYHNYTVISSKEYAIHPSYKKLREKGEFHITGDVALLFLKEPILEPGRPESWLASTTSNPGYALLPNPNQKWDRFNFSFLTIAIGWGLTENATRTFNQVGDPEPQRLDAERIIFQVVTGPEECRTQPIFYGTNNQPNDTFCGAWYGGFETLFGGEPKGIVSTICRGDSGGVLIIPSTNVDAFNFQGDVQIGIVSAGPPCPYIADNDTIAWPAEYVDVSQYVPWIHDEMKSRGYTPLQVATNPLGRAYRDQTCFPGNCFEENVMEGVLSGEDTAKASNAACMVDVKMTSLVGIVAAALLLLF